MQRCHLDQRPAAKSSTLLRASQESLLFKANTPLEHHPQERPPFLRYILTNTEPMPTRLQFAIPLVCILGSLSLLHAYWALGGRWGSAFTVPTVSGRRMFNPSPLATWIVSLLLALGVILVLENAFRIATGPLSALFTAGLWVLSLVFLLRAVGNFRSFGFFKTITETPFAHWDTWLYSPLCLLLTFLAAALACSPRVR